MQKAFPGSGGTRGAQALALRSLAFRTLGIFVKADGYISVVVLAQASGLLMEKS
jgi:hypothetical protein